MTRTLTPDRYHDLRRIARRHSRRPDEIDDLVQEALLEAVRAGRTELADLATQRWLAGIIRNKARLAARTALRRRRREAASLLPEVAPETTGPEDFARVLADLPAALKAVAALALTGHDRREIAWLLGLGDAALRQRVHALRRRLAGSGIAMPAGSPGLALPLHYGRIRDALLPSLLRQGGLFASHDPDGHLFIVSRSRNRPLRQQDDITQPRSSP